MIDNHELDRSLKTLTFIWGANLVSVLIYLFVIPRFLGEDILAFLPPESHKTIQAILYVVSIGAIFLARFLSKYILSGRMTLSQRTAVTRHPAIQRYSTAMILALAFSEAIAIFGLVLFLMAKDTVSLYLFGIVSILSMLMYRPVRQDILDTARNLEMLSRVAGTRPVR